MLLPHTYAYIVPYFAIHPPMRGDSRPFFTHVYDHLSLYEPEGVGVPYAIMHQNQWFFIGTQIARELENY